MANKPFYGNADDKIRDITNFKWKKCIVCETWKPMEEFPHPGPKVSEKIWFKSLDAICLECEEKKERELMLSVMQKRTISS